MSRSIKKKAVKKSTVSKKSAGRRGRKQEAALKKQVKRKKKTIKKKAAKKAPGRQNHKKAAQLEAALIKQGKFMYKRPGEGSDKLIMRIRDIEIVMECSYRTACRHMAKIRKALELLPDQPLSVKEFCKYKRLDEADVQRKLKAY